MDNLSYLPAGDYQIPALTLSLPHSLEIGKYGQMRKHYLKEQKPAIYSHMLLAETLYPHLMEVDRAVREQVKQTTIDMAQAEGIKEVLKENDQLEWVRRMNNIKHRAEEMVMAELIYK